MTYYIGDGDAPIYWADILGVFGIYLRLQSDESPAFSQEKQPTDIPLKIIYTNFRTPLFLAIILTSILAWVTIF